MFEGIKRAGRDNQATSGFLGAIIPVAFNRACMGNQADVNSEKKVNKFNKK